MTENHSPSTQAALPTPVTEPAAIQAAIQATSTPSASVTATAAAATAAVNSPSMNAASEQLPCQWVGCTEKSPNAESLYVSWVTHVQLEINAHNARIGACL